jgi:arylformamidase
MSRPRIVDLSYRIASEMLVYPRTERPSFQWVGRVNSEGYNLTRMTMLVHTGTHVDAPRHFLDGVPWVDEIPLERFFCACRLFRCAGAPTSRAITLREVRSSGFDMEAGEAFLLATGIETLAETSEYNTSYPYPAPDLVEWLLEKNVASYMTDATSVDPLEAESSPNHHRILGAHVPIVENLRNLGELPADRPFVICALPLKLGGREGAPCRAVALPDVPALGFESVGKHAR